MSTSVIGHELFAVAIEMEATGESFYRALALGSDNPEVRVFCLRTAREEAGHQIALQELRNSWAGPTGASPTHPDRLQELAALAKREIQPDPRATRRLAMGGDLISALDMAIQMERNAIVFYKGLLAAMPGAADVIGMLIAEEEKHLGELRALRA